MPGRVLVAGIGDVGGRALHLLAHAPTVSEILALDIEADRATRVNSARYCAEQLGRFPALTFVRHDVRRVKETQDLLQEFRPDVILNATTVQSWWLAKQLPGEVRDRLAQAEFGPWLPFHLSLTRRLMQGLAASKLPAALVNVSYPDVVNFVLGKVGLAPAVGAGNVDLLVPPIRAAIAERLKLPGRAVTVLMVAHHAHVFTLLGQGRMRAPYALKVLLGDRDVTPTLPRERIFRRVAARYAFPADRDLAFPTAASAAKMVLGLLDGPYELTHGAGPNGLPGGYPVRLGRGRAELVLPAGMTLRAAVRLNLAAQRADGIEGVRRDGTVVFAKKSASAMREVLGYDCPALRVGEVEDRAEELKERFGRLLPRRAST